MRLLKFSIAFIFISLSINIFSQDKEPYLWWNPSDSEFDVVEGQAWPGKVEKRYDRLSASAKDSVRSPLWNLSHNSAGLQIRFISNSPEIIVRYKVSGSIAMPHMPATGVSGVDLYSKNIDGEWEWHRGGKPYNSRVVSKFSSLTVKEKYHDKGREYRLYLPLYNSIDSFEIGVIKGSVFNPLPVRKEKPIVVYGTSIAQGACASRPGMAWTAILERKMDRPLINLGFSGNGRLEKEMIDLIAEIDAKAYILDCLPNLLLNKYTPEDVYERIINSVNELKNQRPDVPILLVDHAGNYPKLNELSHKAFADLKASGVKGLFLLTNKELGLYYDSFVDGTHPSDYGMMAYALAYEQKLQKILNEPVGDIATQVPVTQLRDANTYNWIDRHQKLLKMNESSASDICLFGNSITHFWGGEPHSSVRNGEESWNSCFKGLNVRNFAFGWDRIENVLWRVYHDELAGFDAKQIILMLGTNNLGINTNDDIVDGIEFLLDVIKSRQPDTNILILGIYPRRDLESRVAEINLKLSQLAELIQIDYANVGFVLVNKNGKINESLFLDGLHPNGKGYKLLASEIEKYLKR